MTPPPAGGESPESPASVAGPMATETLRCERHGEATRLTCVDCGRPICPKCMVRTEVGLKCERCSEPAATPVKAKLVANRRPLILVAGGVVILAAVVLILALGSGSDDEPAAAPPVGSWSEEPGLRSIRGTATAVTLDGGEVLVAGGGVGAQALASAEIYGTDAGEWTDTGALNEARRGHRAVALDDGRVLATGGIAGGLVASSEIYDPATGAWSFTAPMAAPRVGHSLTLLGDGRVLVAGGSTSGPGEVAAGGQTINPTPTTEIYDPATGNWSPGPDMSAARFEHTATLLDDGRVLMAGGLGPSGGIVSPLASTEIFDPAASIFISSGDLAEGRTNHAASLLDDGRVLVSGGAGGQAGDLSLASAELFDPGQGGWSAAPPLSEARTGHTSSLLDDGRVLVSGGEANSRGTRRSLSSAEVLESEGEGWRSAGKMACFRSEQAAVVLDDGSVLVVAGDATFPGQPPLAQGCADRYQP